MKITINQIKKILRKWKAETVLLHLSDEELEKIKKRIFKRLKIKLKEKEGGL